MAVCIIFLFFASVSVLSKKGGQPEHLYVSSFVDFALFDCKTAEDMQKIVWNDQPKKKVDKVKTKEIPKIPTYQTLLPEPTATGRDTGSKSFFTSSEINVNKFKNTSPVFNNVRSMRTRGRGRKLKLRSTRQQPQSPTLSFMSALSGEPGNVSPSAGSSSSSVYFSATENITDNATYQSAKSDEPGAA